MRPNEEKEFNDLNLVLEFCDQNLHSVIRINNDGIFTDHIKYLTYEMMKGVFFIHSKGIIHRDLKPLNILITKDWEVKIGDFGQANVQTDEINKDCNLTKYVSTRYYRAPELYIDYVQNYTAAVDMWAVGCIIAELYLATFLVQATTADEYLTSLV